MKQQHHHANAIKKLLSMATDACRKFFVFIITRTVSVSEHCSKVLIWNRNNQLIAHTHSFIYENNHWLFFILTSFPFIPHRRVLRRKIETKTNRKKSKSKIKRDKISIKSVFASSMPANVILIRSVYGQSECLGYWHWQKNWNLLNRTNSSSKTV